MSCDRYIFRTIKIKFINVKYLRTFENNTKYETISDVDFFKILETNCKNFSLDDDPLYRGDEINEKFILHNPESRVEGITFVDFFKEKEKNLDTYPVVRKNSSFGVGGGSVGEMIRVASILGSLDDGIVYRVIPFDNSKMVFCPIYDLKALNMFDVDDVDDDNFIMVEYSKNFKVPVKELKKLQKEIVGKDYSSKGFEFFISSPCLLINIKNEYLLK